MFKVNKDFKGINIPVTIRFTESLHNDLHKYAAENDISFNYLVLECCKYALEHTESNEKIKE